MNRFETLLQSEVHAWVQTSFAATLGRTLLHSLWEGAAIALMLAAVLCVARSSRARYAAAWIALIVMVGAVAITFARLAPEEPTHVRLTGTLNVSVPSRLATSPPLARLESQPIDDLAWLTPFWIAGVLIFHLRGLASWMAARRLRQTGVCYAAELWRTRMDRLRVLLRVTRPVVLLESCLTEVPVVIGYLRPVVLMPVGLLTGLPVSQVEAILLHELAHIRRHDYLVNLLQVFVEGLLFYHPAVWWISGVLREERENCCDDLVIAVTNGAFEYATALSALEQRRMNRGAALAATGGSLVNRIQRILGRPRQHYAAAMPLFTAAVMTMTVVTAISALQLGSMGSPSYSVVPVSNTNDRRAATVTRSAEKPLLLAQAQPIPRHEPAESSQPAASTPLPGTKAEENTLRKELLIPYRKWLDAEVAYIISDEERKAFLQLDTDDEREKFVEQFWLRRDPTPGTTENEFKAEIYRRIAYANDHYGDSIPGWQTDRGRIYIQYGPPDAVEAHSDRRPGDSETFQWFYWLYKHIEGIGNNIVIGFVDKTGNGEYRMTMDPSENNILRRPPGGAPSR